MPPPANLNLIIGDDAIDNRPLTPESYYRLPWNLADNAITWLEPTTKCNLSCEGCPDAIYSKGRLVRSCRVDELEKFGCFIDACPVAEVEDRAAAGLNPKTQTKSAETAG